MPRRCSSGCCPGRRPTSAAASGKLPTGSTRSRYRSTRTPCEPRCSDRSPHGRRPAWTTVSNRELRARTTVEVVGLNMDRGRARRALPRAVAVQDLWHHHAWPRRSMRVRRKDASTDAVRRVPHLRCIGPAAAPAVPHPQRGRGPPAGHGDREGTAVLLPSVPRALDARRLPVPTVRLRRRSDGR